MKIHYSLKTIFLFLIITLLTSCNFYRTIPIKELDIEHLNELNSEDKEVIINNEFDLKMYRAVNFQIIGDTLNCDLTEIQEIAHHYDKRLFKLKNDDEHHLESNQWPDPLNTIHIFLYKEGLKEGPYKFTFKEIIDIDIHKKDRLKPFLIGVGAMAATFGVVVGLFASLFYV